jgi:Flp pilus assembly protein TadG
VGGGRRRSRGSGPRAGDASGAALIEFALCLPLLALLIAGIFDFGLLFMRYEVLTNAAREGARMAALPGYSTADVEARVAAYLAAGHVTEAPTTTVVPVSLAGTPFVAMEVTVTLDYSYAVLGPVAALFGGTFGTTTLTATSVMRAEVAAGGD